MAAENLPDNEQADIICVFLADCTLMGNQLLAAALSRDRRFCVVGTAETEENALAGVRNPVDVAIISATLSGTSAGAHLTRRLLAVHPAIRVIMLLERPERDAVVEAFRAGASGVFCRAQAIEVLWKCIESVHRGKIWANDDELKFVLEELASSPSLRVPAHREACPLTEREEKVICLVAEGLTNRQIAAELGLNEHTLKSCLQHLFDKLDVSSRAEMVFAASARAVAEAPDPLALELRGDCRSNDRARYDSYSRAAEHALPFAQLAVGKMCLEGRGTTRDLVAAYAWFLLAEDSANYVGKRSKGHRESLAASMSDEQVAEAEHRASEWCKQHQQPGGSLLPLKNSKKNRRSNPLEKDGVSDHKHALIA